MILFEPDNETHVKSFQAALDSFDAVMNDNFPKSAIRFPRNPRIETVYDFLSMQSEHSAMHPEMLRRNVFNHARKRWENLSEQDFNVALNMFLVLYLTTVRNLRTVDPAVLQMSVEMAAVDGVQNLIAKCADNMHDVIKEGFGYNYEPAMLQTHFIDYITVVQKNET